MAGQCASIDAFSSSRVPQVEWPSESITALGGAEWYMHTAIGPLIKNMGSVSKDLASS